MRRVFTMALSGVLAAGFATTAMAQESQESLQKKLDAKVAEPWVEAGGWSLDYEGTLAKAKESGKPIVAYFTRSYAP